MTGGPLEVLGWVALAMTPGALIAAHRLTRPKGQPTMQRHTYQVRPHGQARGYSPLQIEGAYNFPAGDGTGRTVAFLELGGAFTQADLDAYCRDLGVPSAKVDVVVRPGGANVPDGVDGADSEVMLDVEVAQAIAPAARKVVIQAPNTDAGFIDGCRYAAATLKAGDAFSISWGGPEDEWDPAVIATLDGLFAQLKANGVTVTCASGDNGSRDGTTHKVVDYPASSGSVVACGGTTLTISGDGKRQSETTWSGSGGGASAVHKGRDVPDVAGDADPSTGWIVRVDGQTLVIGGTSAVAPMLAALVVRLSAVTGPFDLMSVVTDHPDVCFDVTAGSNGDYRAGLGRDETTGFGVVDGGRLASRLQPVANPHPSIFSVAFTDVEYGAIQNLVADPHGRGSRKRVDAAVAAFKAAVARQ